MEGPRQGRLETVELVEGQVVQDRPDLVVCEYREGHGGRERNDVNVAGGVGLGDCPLVMCMLLGVRVERGWVMLRCWIWLFIQVHLFKPTSTFSLLRMPSVVAEASPLTPRTRLADAPGQSLGCGVHEPPRAYEYD